MSKKVHSRKFHRTKHVKLITFISFPYHMVIITCCKIGEKVLITTNWSYLIRENNYLGSSSSSELSSLIFLISTADIPSSLVYYFHMLIDIQVIDSFYLKNEDQTISELNSRLNIRKFETEYEQNLSFL